MPAVELHAECAAAGPTSCTVLSWEPGAAATSWGSVTSLIASNGDKPSPCTQSRLVLPCTSTVAEPRSVVTLRIARASKVRLGNSLNGAPPNE